MIEFIMRETEEMKTFGSVWKRYEPVAMLVRCKYCKFYQKPEYGFTKGDCTYGSVWYQTEEDGFCSKAKVKD